MHVSSYCLHFTLRGLIFRSDSLQRQNRFCLRSAATRMEIAIRVGCVPAKSLRSRRWGGTDPPFLPWGSALGPPSSVQGWCSPCSQLIPKVDGCRAAGLAQPAAERRDEKWLEKLESGQNLPRVAKGSRTKRGQTLRCSPSQKSLVFLLEMPSRLALPVLVCHVPCGSGDGDLAMCDPQEGFVCLLKDARAASPCLLLALGAGTLRVWSVPAWPQ